MPGVVCAHSDKKKRKEKKNMQVIPKVHLKIIYEFLCVPFYEKIVICKHWFTCFMNCPWRNRDFFFPLQKSSFQFSDLTFLPHSLLWEENLVLVAQHRFYREKMIPVNHILDFESNELLKKWGNDTVSCLVRTKTGTILFLYDNSKSHVWAQNEFTGVVAPDYDPFLQGSCLQKRENGEIFYWTCIQSIQPKNLIFTFSFSEEMKAFLPLGHLDIPLEFHKMNVRFMDANVNSLHFFSREGQMASYATNTETWWFGEVEKIFSYESSPVGRIEHVSVGKDFFCCHVSGRLQVYKFPNLWIHSIAIERGHQVLFSFQKNTNLLLYTYEDADEGTPVFYQRQYIWTKEPSNKKRNRK